MKTAHVVNYADKSILVLTPYDVSYLEDLKAEVPYEGRKWDPDSKGWRFQGEYAQDALDVTERYFDVVFLVLAEDAMRQKPAKCDVNTCLANVKKSAPLEATLGILPRPSLDLVRSAYRVAMKAAHPDTPGGDKTLAQRVNAAYERLCERCR